MNIRIKATNITLSPAITEYVNKSLVKVTRLIGEDPALVCDVEVGRTSHHHHKGDVFMAEMHITGNGHDAYATASHEDLYTAVNDVRDEILKKLRAGKGKKISYIRRSGAKVKAMVKGLWPFD